MFYFSFKIAQLEDELAFWDLLFKRYANPMTLLQQMIEMNQLEEFFQKVIDWNNEEKETQWLWEIWLHKVAEGTFNDFLKKNRPANNQAAAEVKESDLEAIITNSISLLENFQP